MSLTTDPPNPDYTSLVTHFYRLATRGGGDSARGRYFYMLHALEYAYLENMTSYKPYKKIDQWLVLLFDLITNFKHPYDATAQENHQHIHKALAQPFHAFIASLRALGWQHIATVTDAMTKKHLLHKTELGLHLSQQDIAMFADNMPLHTLFSEYLAQPFEAPQQDGSHPIGRSRLSELRKKFAALYADALQHYRHTSHYPILSVQLIAGLPFSALRIIQHITTVLRNHEELEPHHYDFAVFYALATNAVAHQRSAQPSARWWQAPASYLDPTRDPSADLYDILTVRRQAKTLTRRNYTLARLGLSAAFAQAIYILDTWLETDAAKLQPFHHHQAWYDHIQEYRNEIDALSAQLRGQVSRAYHSSRSQSAATTS